MVEKVLKMIEDFLNGKYNAQEFSYDLPDILYEKYEVLEKENEIVNKLLQKELPEICSYFDLYNTKDTYTLNESVFKQKVLKVYNEIIEYLNLKERKLS